MKIKILAVLLMLSALFGCASSNATVVDPELQTAIDTWNQPISAKSLAQIETVIADDYVHVDSDGVVATKPEMFKGLREFNDSLVADSHKIEFANLKIHKIGEMAYVTYTVKTNFRLQNAAETTFLPAQIAVDIFEKRNGKWLAVYSQESKKNN